jgi:hypothetical protein
MKIPARAKSKEASGRDGGARRLQNQKSSCSSCCKVPVLPTIQTKPIYVYHIAFCIRNKIARERERERKYRSREKDGIAFAAMDDGF